MISSRHSEINVKKIYFNCKYNCVFKEFKYRYFKNLYIIDYNKWEKYL